uniref:Reverse transcriptase domain-containing protein n=1 Tax=Arion vulgaris TaxID=1028688 RepID=A0A0B7BIW8_9EUPU
MKQLEDMNFADDLALLSHNQTQIKDKMNILNNKSQKVGLKIHREKTKVARVNVNLIMLEETALQDVESYTYLSSNIDTEGRTNKNVKIRIHKARGNYIALSKIWQSNEIKTNTKLRIFQSNVKSVLFYGLEA